MGSDAGNGAGGSGAASGVVSTAGNSTAAAGGAGATLTERSAPQPAQNRCSAAIRGVPQLEQNPNPVVISSLPLASRASQSAGVRSGRVAALDHQPRHDLP
jgi:hypothetical protein